ncbi:hypothetical protein AYL99_05173 [Fonsecaea erecta]|uniref:Kinesin motor domain-containing protein n=1 Tax=Fonsecaea erecta TaxID=1367422 RepID=A0A178ZL13_9EURO|nr:hypothetical protein AYL99_05173 [Fonsecaea erecta]OAP60171.1 hypothetical protein AYL99_05173 [Fonsecaea erecta]
MAIDFLLLHYTTRLIVFLLDWCLAILVLRIEQPYLLSALRAWLAYRDIVVGYLLSPVGMLVPVWFTHLTGSDRVRESETAVAAPGAHQVTSTPGAPRGTPTEDLPTHGKSQLAGADRGCVPSVVGPQTPLHCAQIEQLEAASGAAQAENDRLSAENELLQSTIASLHNDLSEIRTLRAEPDQDLKVLEQQSAERLRQCDHLSSPCADLTQDAQRLERRVGELEQGLLGSRNLVRLYRRKTALLEATSRVRRYVAASLDRKNRHNEDRIRRLTAERNDVLAATDMWISQPWFRDSLPRIVFTAQVVDARASLQDAPAVARTIDVLGDGILHPVSGASASPRRLHTFDHVSADTEETQRGRQAFADALLSFHGYHGRAICFIADGESGTGKTYNMFTRPDSLARRALYWARGAAVRSACAKFNPANFNTSSDATATCSFEIAITEWLPSSSSKGRVVAYDHLRNLPPRVEFDCCSRQPLEGIGNPTERERWYGVEFPRRRADEDIGPALDRMLDDALQERRAAPTPLNACSSRSHLVLSVRVDGAGPAGVHVIDLAGSEVAMAKSADDRLAAENAFIHSSRYAILQQQRAYVSGDVVTRDPKSIPQWESMLKHDNPTIVYMAHLHPGLGREGATVQMLQDVRDLQERQAKRTTKAKLPAGNR